MTFKIELSNRAIKELQTLPRHIAVKLKSWVELVEMNGLPAARKIPGYHDEPLKGGRAGQRSIRLSRGYRAFYFIQRVGSNNRIIINEVNKHDY